MGDTDKLRQNIYDSLLDLVTPAGINASGKDEAFGCIFGRDSAITILKILNFLKRESAPNYYNVEELLGIIRRSLLTLVTLQGRESNIESGEQPGKFIHEYREDKFERLIAPPRNWYLYPDKKLRNYDSIDSTPITLIAIYKYWEATSDNNFLLSVLSSIERGLNWIFSYADLDKDNLIEYEFSPKRKHGGLMVQSWTDSRESLLLPNGSMPKYPIAPVEVQGYAWLALKLWSDFYIKQSPSFGKKLSLKANAIKRAFNRNFIFEEKGSFFAAQALDGDKNQIRTVTGNPLLLLWATYLKDGRKETILKEKYIDEIVKRSFKKDMFDPTAGIRTMSTKSLTFNPETTSYHNGSFWPKLNGMAHEGLMNWGYFKEADKLKIATLKPIVYFQTPMELYVKSKKGEYLNYQTPWGRIGCKYQAWTAAAVLDLLT